MDFDYLKKYIKDNDLTVPILEELNCDIFINNENYVSASLPDRFNSDNKGNIHIYKDSLVSRIWTRSVKGDIFNVIAYVLDCESFEAKNWVIETFKIKQDVANYRKKKPVNQWLKMLHSRKKYCGKNEAIDESILLDYEYVNSVPFLEDGISEPTQIEFEIGFDLDSKRFTIPIRNEDGQLVGVKARRVPKTHGVCASIMPESKYIYIERMDKSLEVYGLYKTKPHMIETKKIFLFESEKSVMQAWDFGYKNTGAFSGSDISPIQGKKVRQIKTTSGADIYIGYDSDKNPLEDEELMESIKRSLKTDFYLLPTWEWEEEYCSPTDLGEKRFEELLDKAIKVRYNIIEDSDENDMEDLSLEELLNL